MSRVINLVVIRRHFSSLVVCRTRGIWTVSFYRHEDPCMLL